MRVPLLSENPKIVIDGKPVEQPLRFLVDRALVEMKNPSKVKTALFSTAWIIGLISVYIYYQETLTATEKDSLAYSIFAVFSSMETNFLVNGFFNKSAVYEIYILKDPVTGRWTVPKIDLGVTGLVSLMSAFAFAFLVLEDQSLISYGDFFLQMITYAAQHYFSVMGVFRGVRELQSAVLDLESRGAKLMFTQKVDDALADLSNQFAEGQVTDIEEKFYNETGDIDPDKIVDFILQRQVITLETPKSSSLLASCLYYLVQLTGFGAMLIGSIGYFNSTINGFRFRFSLSRNLAILLATLSMNPVYWLSFILSYRTIEKLAEILPRIIVKIFQGKAKDILAEFPYAIRKAPWFSAICGSSLSIFALFSFYTAVQLVIEAIYDTNPVENPAMFSWMDSGEKAKTFYIEYTRLATILFNIFPVPEIQAFLSRLFCRLTGTPEERKALKVISVLEMVQWPAGKIPEDVFKFGPALPGFRRMGPGSRRPPRKSCCTKVTDTLRWLFRCPQKKAEQLNVNGTTNGYSLN